VVSLGLVVALVGFIFYVSIVTAPPETVVDQARTSLGAEDIAQLDKWRHFVAYATLGGALAYAVADTDLSPVQAAVLVVSVTVRYGLDIEFGQSMLPDRYFSVGDAAANALGGLLVLPWFTLQGRLRFVPVGELLSS
jgi:hypothetical protein